MDIVISIGAWMMVVGYVLNAVLGPFVIGLERPARKYTPSAWLFGDVLYKGLFVLIPLRVLGLI